MIYLFTDVGSEQNLEATTVTDIEIVTLVPSEVVTVSISDGNNDEQSENKDTDIGVTEGSSQIIQNG